MVIPTHFQGNALCRSHAAVTISGLIATGTFAQRGIALTVAILRHGQLHARHRQPARRRRLYARSGRQSQAPSS